MPKQGGEKIVYLYKIDSADVRNTVTDSCNEIELKVFKPSFKGFFLKGERIGMKIFCVRLLFLILTLGKTEIYYVKSGNDILHTSYVIPACGKFPFMTGNDLEIGPCYTYPAFRGKGIYPKVLSEICRRRKNDTSSFYMIVDERNLSSTKGIEKAGFVRCGVVHKSKISRRYKLADCVKIRGVKNE